MIEAKFLHYSIFLFFSKNDAACKIYATLICPDVTLWLKNLLESLADYTIHIYIRAAHVSLVRAITRNVGCLSIKLIQHFFRTGSLQELRKDNETLKKKFRQLETHLDQR